MICPICGEANLRTESISETFSYGDKSTIIDDYVIHICSFCKEAIVGQDTLDRTGKILKERLL